MDEQNTVTTYEPPALVELGEFSEDTLGSGTECPDSQDNQSPW